MKTKTIAICLALFSFSLSTYAQHDKAVERLEKSAEIIKDFLDLPNEEIPKEFMAQAEGIILIPKLIKAGFGIGGKHGKGVAMIRDEEGDWSNPVFIKISGGSIGWQIGVQSSEYVLIFRDKRLLEELDGDEFTLGGDISGTAGPEGRNASTATDFKSDGGMFAYSRSKGLFVGISLEGAAISIDKKSNLSYYDKKVDESTDIFNGNIERKAEVIDLHKALNSKFL
jgi:lipid-binding SYLF domain-containing protein